MDRKHLLGALHDSIDAVCADDLRTAETCIADAFDGIKKMRDAIGNVENG